MNKQTKYGSYKILRDVNDKTIIHVTHTCGHVQVYLPFTRILKRGEEKFPGFIDRQYSWLARNLCPGCYNAEKIKNPGLKPNE